MAHLIYYWITLLGAYVKVFWYTPVHICGTLPNKNRGNRPLWSLNIPRRPLDEKYSFIQDTTNLVYERMNCKKLKRVPSPLWRFRCFVYLDWVEANSVPTGNPYPLAAVTDRILGTDFKSKYYTSVSKFAEIITDSRVWCLHPQRVQSECALFLTCISEITVPSFVDFIIYLRH